MNKILKLWLKAFLITSVLMLTSAGAKCSSLVITSAVMSPICSGSTGGVILTVTGGTAPYTYKWNTGATSANLQGLTAGTYAVTITDALATQITASYTIVQRPAFQVSGTVKEACQGTPTGSVTAIITGGNPTFYYQWSTGVTTATINFLKAGSYTVHVTDADACMFSSTFSVGSVALPVVVPVATPATVNEGNTTVLAANATAGSGSITTYAWNTGLTGSVAGGTVKPTVGTSYTVTVTNSNSCSASSTVMVNVIPNPSVGIKAPGLPTKGIK